MWEGYQSFKNISGSRDTEYRFKRYKLEKYLNKKMNVLDVGSNCGFFSMYISKHVNSVNGIEIEAPLCKIANTIKNQLDITNCIFYNKDFKDFETIKRYDLVLSLAVHFWIGIGFVAYARKIYNLLKKDGLFFIESHKDRLKSESNIEFLEKINKIKNLGFIELYQSTIDETEHKRIFIMLRKNEHI